MRESSLMMQTSATNQRSSSDILFKAYYEIQVRLKLRLMRATTKALVAVIVEFGNGLRETNNSIKTHLTIRGRDTPQSSRVIKYDQRLLMDHQALLQD